MNRCKDLFKRKNYFGVRCTLTCKIAIFASIECSCTWYWLHIIWEKIALKAFLFSQLAKRKTSIFHLFWGSNDKTKTTKLERLFSVPKLDVLITQKHYSKDCTVNIRLVKVCNSVITWKLGDVSTIICIWKLQTIFICGKRGMLNYWKRLYE